MIHKEASPISVTVCVIGAGAAGLAAAALLTARGINVMVVEATDVIGGRAQSTGLGNGVINPGAHWIHHPGGNPLSALCDEHGVSRVAFNLDNLTESQQIYHRGRLSDIDTVRVVAVEEEFWKSFDPAAEAAGASMKLVVDRFFATLHSNSDLCARVIIENAIETELCAPMAEIAVSNFDASTQPYDRGDDVIVGGYGCLMAKLAQNVDVRLGAAVTRIEQTGTVVTVELSDGVTVVAAGAILSVPLGVLKAGDIAFEPALPSTINDTIDRLGFGVFEKVFLQFESRWWTTSDKPDGIYLLDAEVFRYWLDVSATSGSPTLVAHIAGSIAHRLAPSPQARIEQAIDALRDHLDRDIPPILNSFATSWAHNQFIRGGYTRLRPGVAREEISRLRQPHGRLILCGEHTSEIRYGYVDGAYSTGLRAARDMAELLYENPARY